MGNEKAHDGYLHKEVWSLQLSSMRDEVTWNFPGEAPRALAAEGCLGEVAHPWTVEENPAGHAVLEAWQARDRDALEAHPKKNLAHQVACLTEEQCIQALAILRRSGLVPPSPQQQGLVPLARLPAASS